MQNTATQTPAPKVTPQTPRIIWAYDGSGIALSYAVEIISDPTPFLIVRPLELTIAQVLEIDEDATAIGDTVRVHRSSLKRWDNHDLGQGWG